MRKKININIFWKEEKMRRLFILTLVFIMAEQALAIEDLLLREIEGLTEEEALRLTEP